MIKAVLNYAHHRAADHPTGLGTASRMLDPLSVPQIVLSGVRRASEACKEDGME